MAWLCKHISTGMLAVSHGNSAGLERKAQAKQLHPCVRADACNTLTLRPFHTLPHEKEQKKAYTSSRNSAHRSSRAGKPMPHERPRCIGFPKTKSTQISYARACMLAVWRRLSHLRQMLLYMHFSAKLAWPCRICCRAAMLCANTLENAKTRNEKRRAAGHSRRERAQK
ncbi:uncharacterized protein NEMAJ01_0154 [Nematocida major]|uniref:uncharacterized protein n=1 Tax=Nematocida major TaxID=1912982 RepID=UPI002007C3CC|nr:uncharacterized protein NEMAJ01_0154 [Nematocida major]KAH9385258.1 hypothetical protein NEMAJ01_0154 [Nematocida major]